MFTIGQSSHQDVAVFDGSNRKSANAISVPSINCALANREILGHYSRRVFGHFFPDHDLRLLFDVSHNTCKVEPHRVGRKRRELYVHRKGATRAFGPGQESVPEALRPVGQPVLIGGSMGTSSYILVGEATAEEKAFSSACHGAGRAMLRHAAFKQWSGRKVVDDLAAQGILIRSPSSRGVAEEAPGAYKDVDAVVIAAEQAGLARRVARLRPLVCIKGEPWPCARPPHAAPLSRMCLGSLGTEILEIPDDRGLGFVRRVAASRTSSRSSGDSIRDLVLIEIKKSPS